MDKSGKMPGWLWIVIGAVVVIFVMNPNILSNLKLGGGGSSGNIVTSATTLSVVKADALQAGNSVVATTYISVNGAPFSTGVTSVSQGDVLDILAVNTTPYHSGYLKGHIVPAATTDYVTINQYKNASVTITVFNTNSVAMTNGIGATNQTVATGGGYNMKVRMDGTDKTSTQDMTCILETSDNTKADTMSLSGFGASFVGMQKPSSYTLAATSSQVWVYDINPISGAVSPEGTISITSKTGQSLTNTYFKMTCKTKEWFLDSNTGKVVYATEDSLGTSKSLASYTFTGYFV